MCRAMLVLMLWLGSAAHAAGELTVQGTVNAVKFKEQKINITQSTIKDLSGEAARDFAVLDPGMLEEVQPGNKIKFSVSQEPNGVLVITDFEVVIAPLAKSGAKKK